MDPSSFQLQQDLSGHKLKYGRFSQTIRKYIFTIRVTEHWHRLLTEIVESLLLEILQRCLDMAL